MTEDNKGGKEQKAYLKIPTFRLLVSSEIGRQLAFVCLETRFKFL